MNYVLGGRTIWQVLGRSGGAAAVPWWLYGGVSAANCVAAYQPIGAASLAASYVNLANPGTYDAAPGTAPTWAAATGWTFAAASRAYLSTGVLINDGWTAIIRVNAVSGYYGVAFGMYENGHKNMYVRPRQTQTLRKYAYAGTNSVSGALTTGVMAMADTACYLNGSADGTIAQAWSGGAATIPLWIGALNFSTKYYFTGSVQAFAIYNTTLSAAQVAAISSGMTAL